MPEIYLLPSRPLPQLRESTLGYLLRLGHHNGHRSLAWVARMHQSQNTSTMLNAFLRQVTGHDEAIFATLYGPSLRSLRSSPSQLLSLKHLFWKSEHRRWCPACLRETGYWKTEWQLTLQIACPEHGQLLQERCPNCDKPMRWYGSELFYCSCGQDLRQTQTIQADDALQVLSQLISAAFMTATGGVSAEATFLPNDWPSELTTLNLVWLCELLWSLGCYATFTYAINPQKVRQHQQIQVLQPILVNSARLLSNWPMAFDKFLMGLVNQKTMQALSLRRFLGQKLAWLHRNLAYPEFHFVRQELERFIALHWKGQITARHHFISQGVKSQHPVISVVKASQLSGLCRDKLAKLVQQGTLQGWSADHDGKRDFLMISRASLDQFLQASGRVFNLIDSAAYLGISKVRLKLFVERGLITPTYRPKGGEDNPVQWMFQQQILDSLLTSVHVDAHASPDCSSLISIDQICRGYTRNGTGMVELLQAIQQDELKVIGHNPTKVGISGILLSREAFLHWLKQRQPEKTVFSLAGAARHLGIKEHALYWLRDRGLICDWRQPESDRITSIHKTALARFRQRYVWGQELAELSGYGCRAASRALINRGVWPVSGPVVDGGITYVFLRADLKAYLRKQAEHDG